MSFCLSGSKLYDYNVDTKNARMKTVEDERSAAGWQSWLTVRAQAANRKWMGEEF